MREREGRNRFLFAVGFIASSSVATALSASYIAAFLTFLCVSQLIANERKSQLVRGSAAAAVAAAEDLLRNGDSGQSWIIIAVRGSA